MSQARQILETAISAFSSEKLVPFFREKSRYFVAREDNYSRYDDSDFKNGTKVGEINYSDNDSLLVCTFEVQKDLSERSGKRAQYEKAKDILKSYENQKYSAGIFVFYDQLVNFRFSLVYPEAIGAKRQWSNFRRFTYFVSNELTNKTFLQRVGDGDFSSLEKVKDAFSVEKVTKEFYQAIANWYFWAVDHCQFPKDVETEKDGRNIAVIRLITRMIFIWFMRERGLVPKDLFEKNTISKILKDLQAEDSSYYTAILQNLFFATLSTKKEERQFGSEVRGYKGYNPDFGNQYVFRHQELFKTPEKIKEYFGSIPFLNGGLFECLDDKKNGIIIDGFSRTKKNQPNVPNLLFFSQEIKADLNKAYGTAHKTYDVRGLLDILSSFNFTIDENSPDDADVALDPELLGRVFENLLASFNPETSTTARKATGSYYTPREIVDYMVTESLKAYFKTHLSQNYHSEQSEESLDEKLENLFAAGKLENPFDQGQSKTLVELIESVKIVDPAVGSGAFPMGALNKLVFILDKIDPGNELWKQAQLKAADTIPDPSARRIAKEKITEFFQGKNADYGRKLFLIQRCIYGVDIQQIAVEIAKLRFFISLLVDEKIDKDKENWGIEPLPNLDFKIMQGNSLISEFLGIDFDNGNDKQKQHQGELLPEQEEDGLIKKFDQKKIDFQNESDKDKKAELKTEVEDLMIQIFETKVKKQKSDYFKQIEEIEQKYSALPNEKQREAVIAEEKQKLSKKSGFDLDNIEKQLREFTSKKKTSPFFPWKLYFAEVFEKGGFDIAIANPPYIKEYTQRSAFDGLRNSQYYQGKMDLWYFFACKDLDFLKKDSGVLAFIAQNNWVTSYGASILRNKIINETQILHLIDFGDYKIFECAGIQTMVMVFLKNQHKEKYKFNYRRLIESDLKFEDVLAVLHQYETKKAEYLQPTIVRSELKNKPLTFSNSHINEILERMIAKANFQLDSNEDVAQGIVYPQDSVNKASQKILGNKYNIGAGIFVLNALEKENILFTEKELSLIKPSYATKELFRWYGNRKNSEWVIYTDSSFKHKEKIEEYPNIKKHLDQFKNVITSDNKPYGLHRARDERFFLGEKIISVRKCTVPTFSFIDFDSYVSATFYIIKTERINQKFLVSLLNSNLFAFWLRHKGKMQGNNYQIDKEPLLNLPILKPTEKDQQPFTAIVDKILAIAKTFAYLENPEKQTQVKEYEKQIDQLVYQLYDLTPEEIEIVEGNV